MSTYRFTRANVEDTSNRVYDFILEYINENGYPPAVRDICAGIGVRSTSTIHNHLKRLHEAGRIDYAAGKRRAIVIPEQQEERPVFLPLVGQITAGIPIFAEENIERNLPFPAGFFSDDAEVFALQVKGDSMVGAAILDKDYVIVRQQSTAKNGDIIAALVGDEATVKTLANVDGQMVLQPENPRYSPIPFNAPDCQVLGVVCAVFRVNF